MTNTDIKPSRISYLDGHRGIAIILVVLFHAFARWPELVPYGSEYSSIALVKYGYLGVELFFLISGFVILMTLERCKSTFDFMYKRWLRLFPAMLICSIIIYISSGFFVERPNGSPNLLDIIPGLTFIEPFIIKIVSGLDVSSLEGAFWSLYVEFKFYIFAAIVYYIFGRNIFVGITLACHLFSYLFYALHNITDNQFINIAYVLSNTVLSFHFFGWFAAGSAYYIYTVTGEKKWFLCGCIASFISAYTIVQLEFMFFSLDDFIAACLICILFACSIVSKLLQKVLSARLLLFIGYISYPLYLLHENMMISLVIKLDKISGMSIYYVLPLIAIIFIGAIAFVVTNYLEKPLKNVLAIGSFKK